MVFAPEASVAAPRGVAGRAMLQPGEVSAIHLAARQAGIRHLKLSSHPSSSGRLVLDGFSGTLGGGTITGSGIVDFAAPGNTHRLRICLSNVDAESMLRLCDLKFDAKISACVNATFDLSWSGMSMMQARRTANGTVAWRFAPGAVQDAGVLADAVRLTGIEQLRRFQFSEADVTGVVREGIMEVKRLHAIGSQGEITASGMMDLPTRRTRLNARVRLSAEMLRTSTRPEIKSVANVLEHLHPPTHRTAPVTLVEMPFKLTLLGPVDNLRVSIADPDPNAKQEKQGPK